jgi:plastocyanin
MFTRRLCSATAVVAFVLALSACGDSGSDDTSAQTSTTTSQTTDTTGSSAGAADSQDLGIPGRVDVQTPAGNKLVFEPKRVTGKLLDGKLTVNWDNDSDVFHNFCIEDTQGKVVFKCTTPIKKANQGGPIPGIKPGKYTYYCGVDGHRQAGMEGTLTVTR